MDSQAFAFGCRGTRRPHNNKYSTNKQSLLASALQRQTVVVGNNNKKLLSATTQTLSAQNDANNKNRDAVPLHCGVSALGLSLQIVFMYLGKVHRRFLGTMWLYSDLTVVYYAMSHPFSTQGFVSGLAQHQFLLTKFATTGAMIIETMGPLLYVACNACGCGRIYPNLLLCSLHFGYLITMQLPNWQLLGMLMCMTWTPIGVWDD